LNPRINEVISARLGSSVATAIADVFRKIELMWEENLQK